MRVSGEGVGGLLPMVAARRHSARLGFAGCRGVAPMTFYEYRGSWEGGGGDEPDGWRVRLEGWPVPKEEEVERRQEAAAE
jgi:hypothetical protein